MASLTNSNEGIIGETLSQLGAIHDQSDPESVHLLAQIMEKDLEDSSEHKDNESMLLSVNELRNDCASKSAILHGKKETPMAATQKKAEIYGASADGGI